MPRSTQHPMWLLAKERRLSYRPWRKDVVEVRIALTSPVAAVDGEIRLDALLQYCVLQDLVEEARRRGHRHDIPRTVWTDAPLPLAKLHSGEGDEYRKIHCASFAMCRGSEFVTRWKKRWEDEYDDLADFGKKQTVVDHKTGWSKNYDMPLVAHAQRELIFYARGVADEIERLLTTYLAHIGKKGSQGFGRVKSVVVQSHAEDWSVWREGEPMRAIPLELAGDVDGFGQRFCGYRPPYWMPEHQCLCVA